MTSAEPMRAHTGPEPRSAQFWPLAVSLIVLSVAYCLPLFTGRDYWGRQDWDQFTFRYETPRVALLRDHVLPTWNPYAGGGNVLLAHPDSPALSPWYGIVLLFGAPLGLRLQVLAFMALGAVGMGAFTRRLGASPLGAAAGGIVFMMSSHFALHITEGHLEWCVLGLMPWIGWCLIHQTRVATVAAALLLASVLTFGSVYVPAIFLPFFSVWMLFEAVRRRRLRPLVNWSVCVTIAALLAAPKLLPVVAFSSQYPRAAFAGDDAPLSLWPTMFGDPRQTRYYQAFRDRELPPGHFAKVLTDEEASPYLARLQTAGLQLGFHEFGCYIGAAGIVLAVLGVVATARRFWPLYAAGLLAGVAVLGSNAPIDVWSLLQQLPLYQQLRVPSRFLMAVLFVLALAAAFGMTRITGTGSGASRRRWWSALVILAALYAELMSMGWMLFRDVFVVPPLTMPVNRDFAHRCDGRPASYQHVVDSAMYRCLRSNSGDLDAYENLSVHKGAVRLEHDPEYRGEAYLENGQGTAGIRRWTMSHVVIDTSVSNATHVVLNQNYDAGWQATVGHAQGHRTTRPAARSDDGLVSVPVDERVVEVEFFYVTAGFHPGLIVSIPTLCGCLWFLVRMSRRGRSKV